MQPRIIINLQENEYKALLDVAQREYRPIRLQAEKIFRDALIERGIIEDSPQDAQHVLGPKLPIMEPQS